MTAFSLLELVRVTQDTDAGTALNNAWDLASHAEGWGYKRVWVAEHHNMAGIASAATAIVIAHIAGGTGEMVDRLEFITNPGGALGWYLATKVPLHDAAGRVIGIASISRDLATPSAQDVEFAGVHRIVSDIQKNLEDELHLPELAQMAGLSPSQLDRRMRGAAAAQDE